MDTQKQQTINILNDLSSLTKVPAKILHALSEKELLCIGSAIKDAVDKKDEVVLLNIGLGTLSVNLADMQCKFVPSTDFKMVLKRAIKSGIDPLEYELEQTLIEKLIKIYEEEI